MQDSLIIDRFNSLSVIPIGSNPDEFDRLIKKDLERWPKLIRELGIIIQ